MGKKKLNYELILWLTILWERNNKCDEKMLKINFSIENYISMKNNNKKEMVKMLCLKKINFDNYKIFLWNLLCDKINFWRENFFNNQLFYIENVCEWERFI